MEKRLEVCNSIKIITDQFFAHTAHPNTIKLPSEQNKIALDDIRKCIKAIFQVKNRITEILFWTTSAGVPLIEYGTWDNISKKWVESDAKAEELWDKVCNDMNSWLNTP